LAESGGNRGVKGITATAQNFRPHIGGAGLWADDDAFDLGHADSSVWCASCSHSFTERALKDLWSHFPSRQVFHLA
jgi:hypothetical protein